MFLNGCEWEYKILFCNMRISHMKFKYQSSSFIETQPPHWFSYGLCVCLGKEVITTQQYFLCPIFKSVIPPPPPHPQFPAFLISSVGFSTTGWEDGLGGGEVESSKN